MAEVLISILLQQLGSNAFKSIGAQVRLVKGVEKEVGKLTSNLQAIQAVLLDAEKRQVNDAAVRDWLDKLKDVSFSMDDVLDEWITAICRSKIETGEEEKEDDASTAMLKKVRFFRSSSWFPCIQAHQVLGLCYRRNLASRMKGLNKKLDSIAIEKTRYNFNTAIINEQPDERRMKTTSFIDNSQVYGRDKEKEILIARLLGDSQDGRALDIVPIVGMGGIGKTTLAQLAFHDDKVKVHFEKKVWLCVSEPFDETRIAKAIIESLKVDGHDLVELEALLQCICKSIEGKRFLLVLDDVWTEDARKWEPLKESLKSAAVGSRILVTTRKKEVAIMMGVENHMINLSVLSKEACWSIFSQLAFLGREKCEQLEEIGKQIASKCKGVPLVAKTLGSLMRFKRSRQQWEEVLHSELWEIEDVKIKVFVPFLFSYYDLLPVEKRCLTYCSVLPKDYEIDRDDLIELWMSQGYLSHQRNNKNCEKEGHDCFENLAMHSFFQDFELDYDGNIRKCTMHDIVHDFVQFLAKNESYTLNADNVKEKMYQIDEMTRHSTLLLGYHGKIPTAVSKSKKLRTLCVMSGELNDFPRDLSCFPRPLLSLTCLRTLNLQACGITCLTDEISKLIHLRYLNLSGNIHLEKLPNALCDLLNLQTLRLKDCKYNLQWLPKQIEKLVNLRHLHIEGCDILKGLPKGIEKLNCLQTLDMFIAPWDDYLQNNEALKLEDLSQLKHLQGYIHMSGCGYLKYSWDQASGRKGLMDKEYLVDLKLAFERPRSVTQRRSDESIRLEALQPNPNLKSLEIESYRGTTLSPNWMASLINLKKLQLSMCRYCEVIMPLGRLPSLESLHMEFMLSAEKLGLGAGNGEYNLPNSPMVLFPKLKQLRLHELPRWTEWEEEEDEDDCCLTIMPCLQSLEISGCHALRAVPDFLRKTPLQNLIIVECEHLYQRCQREVGEDWLKISHIPNIQTRISYHDVKRQCDYDSDSSKSSS